MALSAQCLIYHRFCTLYVFTQSTHFENWSSFTCERHYNKLLCVCHFIDQITMKICIIARRLDSNFCAQSLVTWQKMLLHPNESRCQSHKFCTKIAPSSTSFTHFEFVVVCRKVLLFVEWLCINIYKSSDRFKNFNVKSTLFQKFWIKTREKSHKKPQLI